MRHLEHPFSKKSSHIPFGYEMSISCESIAKMNPYLTMNLVALYFSFYKITLTMEKLLLNCLFYISEIQLIFFHKFKIDFYICFN